ncbi:hypothetical protein SAMN05192558_102130 [Actinokineospora alba]|uniref:Uncharacterized protein n=1 Tax=Actinokineospora alba TaxID=504798 RepID=A0A1H0HIJ3_9PSEU|nr:hypothetical protein [Actinokineospora alba]TDP64873.1 hypothetical protein C8E96_0348 [Actinokineospora alba]SDH48092.1 hypothetical protein SAMN05421871_101173 [Actinokineospora alba]SDO18920.1 hypothetical protein SAMN05192558_102130 [Actinokineospora alba]
MPEHSAAAEEPTDDRTPPSGIPAIPQPRQRAPHGPPDRDDATRYLCAAAHLDPGYATAAIKEFLVEPTRAVPPSPGVDAGAVLTEALAARTRRKVVDLALLVLTVAFLFAAPMPLILLWLVLGVTVSIPRWSRAGESASNRRMSTGAAVGVGVLIVAVVLVAPEFERLLYELDLLDSRPSRRGSSSSADDEDVVGLVFTILLPVAMLVITFADRYTVWRLVTTRFNRTGTITATEPRQILQYAARRFRTLLTRYAAPQSYEARDDHPEPGAPAGIVVHRGYEPFVGAGRRHRPWSVAAPLLPHPNGGGTRPLSTAALYDAVVAEISDLHRATAMTPGGRLSRLTVDEEIVVSARELIDHLGDHTKPFLEDTPYPPYTKLSARRVHEIRDNPIEWARYYRCFRVETWDRDLVLSVYLHVALDDSTLYVEWTPCVLLPIREQFQRIDSESISPARPAIQAAADVLALLVAAPGKLVSTLTFLRPLRADPGVIDPDRYGSLRSLRELAADDGVHNYFQLADVDRYLKILESRLVLAVSKLLADAGYVTASFESQAAAVIQNNVHIGGSVTGNVVAGIGNLIGNGPTPGKQA